jgi:hypothetical protein
VNRSPGRYLIYVQPTRDILVGGDTRSQPEGYYDWQWVDLKDAKSTVTVDLVIDPAKLGHVEVALPRGRDERIVIYLPVDSEGKLPFPEALWYMSSMSSAKVEGDKAVIRGLRQGKYQLALYDPLEQEPTFTKFSAEAIVEVRSGATTKVELNPSNN